MQNVTSKSLITVACVRPQISQERECIYNSIMHKYLYLKKGKAVPLQAWSGPDGSRDLGFPDIMTKVKQSRYRPGVAQRAPGN